MIKGAKKVPRRLPKYLNLDDLKKLLDTPYHTNPKDRLILRILAKCGLRASEVVGLKIEDVNFQTKRMNVFGKGSKERVVPIPPDVLEMIKEYATKNSISVGRIFPITVQGINAIVRKYAQRSGLLKEVGKKKDGKPLYNIHPHTLRHSFAVHSIIAGINIRTLQKILGHSRLDTTAIYLQLTDEDIVEEYERHPLPY